MRLINHRTRRLRAGDDVGIGRFDLQRCAGGPVCNQPQMPLDVKELCEFAVDPDCAACLFERDVGDFFRRCDQQEFGVGSAVDDQGDNHNRATGARLGVLLRHQKKELLDHPLVGNRIIRPEKRLDDRKEPLAAGFRHGRRTDHIRNPEAFEYSERPSSFIFKKRKIRNNRFARKKAILPIKAGRVPCEHEGRSVQFL